MSGAASPHDAFDDAHRALALFALAISGRPLRLVRCATLVASPRLPPAGDDAGTVHVGAAGGEDATRAWRIAVLREVLRAEDADPAPRPRGARTAHASLRARLAATLERTRVDAALAARWPGAARDLAGVVAATRARRPVHTPRHPVRALVAMLERASLDDARPQAAPGAPDAAGAPGAGEAGEAGEAAHDPLGLRGRVLAELAPLREPGASAADTARAADRIVAAIVAALGARRREQATLRVVAPDGPASEEAPGTDRGRGEGDAGDRPADAHAGGAPVAVAGGTAPAGSGRGDAPESAHLVEPARLDPDDDDAGARPAPRPEAARAARPAFPGGVLHDEWDHLSGRWLRGWCRVHERRLRGTDTGFLDDVRRRHPELAGALRERFARMRPTGRVRAGRVGDGDELDTDGLVETVVDRRAGHATDERAYVRRDPAVRDVAAAFLVDLSASTAVALPDPEAAARSAAAPGPAPWADTGALLYGAYDDTPEPPPGPPRRRVIDVEKDALALMADALATLGDRCAVWGFSGHGRDDVEFHVAKGFDDPPSRSTWAALAAIEPRGSTRMGAAIRHAAAKLARESASLRLLVVVSDGYPQDTDYGPDRHDVVYGVQDTARALRDVEAAGMRTFCVTVDPAGHDYLRRMCPPRRYLVIDDVPALPAELARVYATLAGRG